MEAEQILDKKPITTLNLIDENDPKISDIRQKLMIVYNVLLECSEEESGKDRNMLLIKTVDILKNLTAAKNFDDLKALRQIEVRNVSESNNIAILEQLDLTIRRVLGFFYLNNKKIPTMESIKQYIDVSKSYDDMRQNLKRCGYIWKCLGNTKRAILMEHPKQTVERQQYFLKLNRYREQQRFFVYVDIKVMNKDDINIQYFENHTNAQNPYLVFFVAASHKGYIDGTTIATTTVLKCQELFEKYFIENILPRITEPSVITLEDNTNFRKSLPVPTVESEKNYMLQWLQTNGIPHEKHSHRSELFELIRRCKNKVDLHKFDAILRAKGHEVLRRPARANYLNFYKPFWDAYLASNTKTNNTFLKLIIEKPSLYWEQLQNYLLIYERVIYTEDLQLENVIDKILTMAQTVNVKEWTDIECDVEEDTLKQEEYLIDLSF